ncbi:putative RNA recognition motif-containing protein [Penicillium brasilianum]|uniref:Putative RNA recognition motif-containing protein n=1 Tax=Penicillium brasilianum TaxID=104259 RepID=A0A1S9RME2_PENBI|nr:putative RNA recognition motif-containing protein [Penicillium brasilianum]
MPPQPGEERLVTVFADIHYYFTAPTPRPLQHRFEKGSYLYVYHDASQNRARIEIANNPGTPDQDAFYGVLNNVHVRHSTHFPTHCTLTVDGIAGSTQHQVSQYDWRLPGPDSRSGHHELHRLHTLDIYFWTLDDTNDFLDTIGRVLPVSQLETDRPNAQPEQPMSSVVQQLENVAISHPAYQNGQTPNSRSEPTAMTAPTTQGPAQTMSFPPPPPSGPAADQQSVNSGSQSSPEDKRDSASFAPLPYNPAAPAAPEPIKHREKTPPPPDDGTEGTGLAAALAADQGIPYTPPHQVGNAPGFSSFAPPPSSAQGVPYSGAPAIAPMGYASPPPSAGLTHTNSFPTQQPVQSPGAIPGYSQPFQTGQTWPSTPGQGAMSFAPPPQDPNAHLYAQQVYGTPQSPPQQFGQAVAIGGYSNYSYAQAQAQPAGSSEYNIHSQLYRPTEAEAGGHGQKYAQKAMKAPGQRPRKLEDNAMKLESGVNRFLKKLEKKL